MLGGGSMGSGGMVVDKSLASMIYISLCTQCYDIINYTHMCSGSRSCTWIVGVVSGWWKFKG